MGVGDGGWRNNAVSQHYAHENALYCSQECTHHVLDTREYHTVHKSVHYMTCAKEYSCT